MTRSERSGEATAHASTAKERLGRRVSRGELLEARLAARRSAAAERLRVRENFDSNLRRQPS